jgi:hypothetical protein
MNTRYLGAVEGSGNLRYFSLAVLAGCFLEKARNQTSKSEFSRKTSFSLNKLKH